MIISFMMTNISDNYNSNNNFSGNENLESVAEAIENAALEIVDEEIMRKEGEAHQQDQLRRLANNHKAALLKINGFGSAIAALSAVATQHQPHQSPHRRHPVKGHNSKNDGRAATTHEHVPSPANRISSNEPPQPPRKTDRSHSISNSNSNSAGVDNADQSNNRRNTKKNINSINHYHAQIKAPLHPTVLMFSGQTFHQFACPMGIMPSQFAPGYPMPPPGGYSMHPAAPIMPMTYSHPSMPPPQSIAAASAQAHAAVLQKEKPNNHIDRKNPSTTQTSFPSRAKYAKELLLNDSEKRNDANRRRPPTTSKKSPSQSASQVQASSNPLNHPCATGPGPIQSKPFETWCGQEGETNQPQLNKLGFITNAQFLYPIEHKNSEFMGSIATERQSLNRNYNRNSEIRQEHCNPLIQDPRCQVRENENKKSSNTQNQTSKTVNVTENNGVSFTSTRIQAAAMDVTAAILDKMKDGQQSIEISCGQNFGTDQKQGSHCGKKRVLELALPPLEHLDSKANAANIAPGGRTTAIRPPSESDRVNVKLTKRNEEELKQHRIHFPPEHFTPRIPLHANRQKEKRSGEYFFNPSHHSHKFLIRDYSSPHWDASESVPEGYVQFLATPTSQDRQALHQLSWNQSVGPLELRQENHQKPRKCLGNREYLLSEGNCRRAVGDYSHRQDYAGYETKGFRGETDVNRDNSVNFSEEESMVDSQSHVEV